MLPVYERIEMLCKENGINITTMCKAAGVPRSVLSDYKTGRKKSISTKNIELIADYFCVSVDYVLCKTDIKNTPSKLDEELEGVEFALWGEVREMTEAQKRDVLKFAKFIKNQNLDKG